MSSLTSFPQNTSSCFHVFTACLLAFLHHLLCRQLILVTLVMLLVKSNLFKHVSFQILKVSYDDHDKYLNSKRENLEEGQLLVLDKLWREETPDVDDEEYLHHK